MKAEVGMHVYIYIYIYLRSSPLPNGPSMGSNPWAQWAQMMSKSTGPMNSSLLQSKFLEVQILTSLSKSMLRCPNVDSDADFRIPNPDFKAQLSTLMSKSRLQCPCVDEQKKMSMSKSTCRCPNRDSEASIGVKIKISISKGRTCIQNNVQMSIQMQTFEFQIQISRPSSRL